MVEVGAEHLANVLVLQVGRGQQRVLGDDNVNLRVDGSGHDARRAANGRPNRRDGREAEALAGVGGDGDEVVALAHAESEALAGPAGEAVVAHVEQNAAITGG